LLNKSNPNIFFNSFLENFDKTEENELIAAKYIDSKLNLNLRITDFKNIKLSKEMEKIAADCFDGCIDAGVASFGSLGKFVKENNAKCMIVSEGPDELLGGYHCDIEANIIDKAIGPNKPLSFLQNFSSTSLGKKLLIKLLRLKKNKEFEFKYQPFTARVNHSVCPNEFIKKITENFDFKEFNQYGTIEPMYDDILPFMDLSQKRALNYASKTLPDMYNLRLDKAFMRHSVEVRLPYQAVNLVEFFIAMPNKYRFKGRQGKFFLRKYVGENIDKKISKRKKYGLGPYLWSDKLVYNSLKIDDIIMSSNFFEKYPFNKNIKKILFDKNTHKGNKWAAYALIKTFENNKKINQH
jgi:asparagine synthase (glutamine-hydrolysing)